MLLMIWPSTRVVNFMTVGFTTHEPAVPTAALSQGGGTRRRVRSTMRKHANLTWPSQALWCGGGP
jgi:hypothetical protein